MDEEKQGMTQGVNDIPDPYEHQHIVNIDINKEVRTAFLDYSMSVIISRALPDVRDGLKPVHRRILYTMYENNLTPDKAYRKCADTVGSVLGIWIIFVEEYRINSFFFIQKDLVPHAARRPPVRQGLAY